MEPKRKSRGLGRAASATLAAGRRLSQTARSAVSRPDSESLATHRELPAATDYFVVANTPRFRASQRAKVRDSARHGLAMVVGAVGVATIGEEDLGMDEDDWFARADAALYRAKARGRNMIEDENPIGRAVRTTPVERASA